jgi:hypothetical protein
MDLRRRKPRFGVAEGAPRTHPTLGQSVSLSISALPSEPHRRLSRMRERDRMSRSIPVLLLTALLAVGVGGCSMKKLAADAIGPSLAEPGVYAEETDPDLVKESLPFGLKTLEGLQRASPDNPHILLALSTGFAGYALLLKDEADRLGAERWNEARVTHRRASDHFTRARDYALTLLEQRHPGLRAELLDNPEQALAATGIEDLSALYLAGATWAAALSADKSNLALLGALPIAAAMVRRVLELDETHQNGAAHEFFISYEGGRPGGSAEAARRHYERALALSGGNRASVHLALAEAVAVPAQDVAEFRRLVGLVRQTGDAEPGLRFQNAIARRRAAWLSEREPELFISLDM